MVCRSLSSEGLLLDELHMLLEGLRVGLPVVLGPLGEVVEELELLEPSLQGVRKVPHAAAAFVIYMVTLRLGLRTHIQYIVLIVPYQY